MHPRGVGAAFDERGGHTGSQDHDGVGPRLQPRGQMVEDPVEPRTGLQLAHLEQHLGPEVAHLEHEGHPADAGHEPGRHGGEKVR